MGLAIHSCSSPHKQTCRQQDAITAFSVELTVEFTNFSTPTAFGQPTIAFRLKTTHAQVEKLLDRGPIDPILRFFRLGASDLVVARIEDLKKVRRYEFGERSHGADEYDVELHIETPPKFVATGELIDIIQLSGQ